MWHPIAFHFRGLIDMIQQNALKKAFVKILNKKKKILKNTTTKKQ